VITLAGPDPRFREVMVDGWMLELDDEFMAAGFPHDTKDMFKVVHLGPDQPHWDDTGI